MKQSLSLTRYIEECIRNRTRRRRLYVLMGVLCLAVALGVTNELMKPAITATAQPICGREAHLHGEDCFEDVLTCGLEPGETHEHTGECWARVLVCTLGEHTHIDSCYPQELAEPTLEPTEAPTVEPSAEEAEPALDATGAAEEEPAAEVTDGPTQEPAASVEPTQEPSAEGEATASPDTTTTTEETTAPEETQEVSSLPVLSPIEGAARLNAGEAGEWSVQAEHADTLRYEILSAADEAIVSGELLPEGALFQETLTASGLYTVRVTAENELGLITQELVLAVTDGELRAEASAQAAYCFGGDEAAFTLSMTGGVQPVSGWVSVWQGEELLYEGAAQDEVRVSTQALTRASEITLAAAWTDACGETVQAEATLPCPTRKTETRAEWERTLEQAQLNDEWPLDLLEIARTQLGYQEDRENFVVDDEGNRKGYTRYGDWWGADHGEWCAMYVSFCLHYAEIPQTSFPQEANCEKWIRALKPLSLYAEADECQPLSGDLVFFDWENDGHADHVGLVEEVRDGKLFTIEGNSGEQVRRREYELDDEHILGYGLLNAAWEQEKAEREAELDPEASLEPSTTPDPEASLEPSETPDPEASVEPSETLDPEASVEPSETPDPEASVEPSETPDPEASVEPSETPDPEASLEPSAIEERINALSAPGEEADAETLAAYEAELESAAGTVLSLREAGELETEEALRLLEQLLEMQRSGAGERYAELKAAIALLEAPGEDASADRKIEYESLCAAARERCATAWQAGELTKVEYQALKLMLESVPECRVECVYTALEGAVRVVHAQSADFGQAELSAEALGAETEEYARCLEEIDELLALSGTGRVQQAMLVSMSFTGEGGGSVTLRLNEELAACEGVRLARRDADGWTWLDCERLEGEEGEGYLTFWTDSFSTLAVLSLSDEAREDVSLATWCTQRGGVAALELCDAEGVALTADEEGVLTVQAGEGYLLRMRLQCPAGFVDGKYFCAFDERMTLEAGEGTLGEEENAWAQWRAEGARLTLSVLGGAQQTEFALELPVSFAESEELIWLGGTLSVRCEQAGVMIVGEMVEDDSAWRALCASGYFTYWSDKLRTEQAQTAASSYALRSAARTGDAPSQQQVVNPGGSNSNGDGVTVSKTIEGTDLENVFDITLTVETPTEVSLFYEEPDIAVVIVMDISNTMKDNFGGITRYAAAMEAAEDFLDRFVEKTQGVSRVGYVAFNTDAHQIFGLQSCSTKEEATRLKNTMRQATGDIINKDGYGVAHNRFTNIEGGLKMGEDMLAGASNEHKYIILLTDGFPTTYLESGYKGYDPYDTTGRFYDHVLNVPCSSGTSYSNEAAIRARNMAASIKASGTEIFSIGVDVGGQTIQAYIETSEKLAKGEAKISIVDRKDTNYEIGSATSTESYKTWLKSSIGSGYYYDSTNLTGLKDAYNQIFAEIEKEHEEGAEALWVTRDPIPVTQPETVEFIGFYDKNGGVSGSALSGSNVENGENNAVYVSEGREITWDLKKSGYTTTTVENKTIYHYQITYRVRLKNENGAFSEGTVYPTNDITTLTYKVVKQDNGQTVFSEQKTVDYPIPAVKGYLAELAFRKVETDGQPLAGAVFRLTHDAQACSECRGDGSSVYFGELYATSDAEGKVSFARVPSGHLYTLEETVTPIGFKPSGDTYSVEVAYDALSVTVTHPDGTTGEWSGSGEDTVVNIGLPRLPETGGTGTLPYTIGGCALMALSLLCGRARRRRREGRAAR